MSSALNQGQLVSKRRWLGSAIFLVLIVLCAISFNRYLGNAAFYSGIVGLPGRGPDAEAADRAAHEFLWAFVVLEGLASWVIASLIRLPGYWSSPIGRVARFGLGLLISAMATGATVAALLMIGSRFRP